MTKMTLKESIEHIEAVGYLDVTSMKDREALGVVLKEAKKRIPIAVKIDNRYVSELCPACDDFVRLPHMTPMNFCCNCGQRLLWEFEK